MFGRDEKVSAHPPHGGAVHHPRHLPDSGLWTVAAAGDAERLLLASWPKRIAFATCRFSRRAARFSTVKAAPSSTTTRRSPRCCCAIPPATLNADADMIAQGLHLDPNEVRERASASSPSMPQYQPMFLKDDITPDELAFIESHRNELPELDTIMAHRRLYPRNGFMAHLIGYVGEVSEDMLNQPQWELYNSGRRGGHFRASSSSTTRC